MQIETVITEMETVTCTGKGRVFGAAWAWRASVNGREVGSGHTATRDGAEYAAVMEARLYAPPTAI